MNCPAVLNMYTDTSTSVDMTTSIWSSLPETTSESGQLTKERHAQG